MSVHLALPMRFVPGPGGLRAATVEQHSDADVLQGIEVVLAYREGDRRAVPEFGSPPLAHRQATTGLEAVADAVNRWEDRARTAAVSMGLDFYGLLQHVQLKARRDSDE